MRYNIESVFHTKIFDWYGQVEGCASAAQCNEGNYHVNMEYCYVETVKIDSFNKIIGTNLINYAFPLIRYDTGDMGILSNEKCPCGRNLSLLTLCGGRTNQLIKTSKGNKHFYKIHKLLGYNSIREFQLIQKDLHCIDLFLVLNNAMSGNELNNLKSDIERYLDKEIKVSIIVTDHIKRGPRGKHQSIISRV
jgi:phenylacetate-CoA ligase